MEKSLHDGLGLGGPVGLAHPGLGLGGPPTVPYSAPSQRGGGKNWVKNRGQLPRLAFRREMGNLLLLDSRWAAPRSWRKKTRNCKLAAVNAGKLNY